MNLVVSENAQATAQAVAEFIIDKLNSTKNYFNIAVSGGTTPRLLFEIFANEFEQLIDWKKIRLFWVDERCVEPTHAESNFGMTYDALLYKSLIPAENIFRMKGEEIPEFEAERYRELLLNELPANQGFPVFDLILLGIGDDGHTASIFPNDLSLLNAEVSVAVNTNPYTLQKRITLTGNTINNADCIIFLITGKSKSLIFKNIISNNDTKKGYPAAYIQNKSNELYFFADKVAASEIS